MTIIYLINHSTSKLFNAVWNTTILDHFLTNEKYTQYKHIGTGRIDIYHDGSDGSGDAFACAGGNPRANGNHPLNHCKAKADDAG